jgi:hypothetical protein
MGPESNAREQEVGRSEQPGLTADDVSKLIDKRLADLLKQGKRYTYVFCAGFVLLGTIGLGFRELILTPTLQWAYPVAVIREGIAKLDRADKTTDQKSVENSLIAFLRDHVDSGYSKVIVFNPHLRTDDNYLLFYAKEDQIAELTITFDTTDAQFAYTATVDQSPIDNNDTDHVLTAKDRVESASVTKKMRFGVFKGAQGENLHVLRVSPVSPPKVEVIVNCVILVKNAKVT